MSKNTTFPYFLNYMFLVYKCLINRAYPKKIIFLSTFLILLIASCKIPDLPRNNKLDEYNNPKVYINGILLKYDTYLINSDNNADRTVNRGEKIKLNVKLKNIGTNKAESVKATFSSTSEYITGFNSKENIVYGNINPGSSKYYNSSIDNVIEFNVKSTTPDNTIIPINVTMVDGSGNTWTSIFNLTVLATNTSIVYENFIVNSDNNEDGIVNRGEKVKLNVKLKNKGLSKAVAVKSTFTSSSEYITGFSSTENLLYGDINPGSSIYYNASNDNVMEFTVKNTTPDNSIIPIKVTMVDEIGNTWTSSFDITVLPTNALLSFDSYLINSENNGDSTINKGETVKLNVKLKNKGKSSAVAVKATFTSSSEYITGFKSTENLLYGVFYSGVSKYYNISTDNVIEFTVKNTTPDNSIIPITVTMVDEIGNTWTSSFDITVLPTNALLSFDSYLINSENNGDSIINKGETVKLNVKLKNKGKSSAVAVKATFTTSSEFITGFKSTENLLYGDFNSGDSKYYKISTDNVIEFTVKDSTPDNSIIPITVTMVDETGNTWTDNFNLQILPFKIILVYDGYIINSENNGDGFINKGEKIKLNVKLKNVGLNTANAVVTNFTTTSEFITGFNSAENIKYGDINSGASIWYGNSKSNNVIEFTVKTNTPDNTIIPINVAMADESGNTWTSVFNLLVIASKASVTFDNFIINSENNGDGFINKGETVKLNVRLKNIGLSTAVAVKTTFTSTSPNISVFNSAENLLYGDIDPGTTSWYGYNYSNNNVIEFTVKTTTPDNSIIPISVNMVDESGNTWTSNFEVKVVATQAILTYDSYSINAENNGDGAINKGELVKLNVRLKNIGISSAIAVKSTFTSTSQYITGFNSTPKILYGDIDPGTTSWSGYNYVYNNVIEFTVKTTTPDNAIIPINVIMEDESGNTWISNFKLNVSAVKTLSSITEIKYDTISINYENNGDGFINKGEKVKLNVRLKNVGLGTAVAVKANFTSTSEYITGFNSIENLSYGNISSGVTSWYGYYNSANNNVIEFTVKTNTPDNTIIPINVAVADESGKTWTSNFYLKVVPTKASLIYNNYLINSENNGDGYINKGETVKLNVSLKNVGLSKAVAVKTTFTSTSPNISIFNSTENLLYGDINPGTTSWYGYNNSYNNVIEFTVKTTTPDNSIIPISVNMVDESGNTWTSKFEVMVVASQAKLTYDSYSINSENNGDGAINKGELVKLNVRLKNIGLSAAIAVKTTFTSTSEYITGFNSTPKILYGNINPGTTSWYGYNYEYNNVIEFTVKTNTPVNTFIPIAVTMVDESGNTWTSSFDVKVVATMASLTYDSYLLNVDNNSDGFINKGEFVKLNVGLKNMGISKAVAVKTTFTSTSDYITGFNSTPKILYGNIDPGTTSWYGYNNKYYNVIEFTVKTNAPDNAIIPINIKMEDETGNVWTSNFDLQVTSLKASFPVVNTSNNTKIKQTIYENNKSVTQYLIYPNPTSNVLNINFINNVEENMNLRIYDVSGKLILSVNDFKVPSIQSLDVSNFAKGSYYIKLNSFNFEASDKFIIY